MNRYPDCHRIAGHRLFSDGIVLRLASRHRGRFCGMVPGSRHGLYAALLDLCRAVLFLNWNGAPARAGDCLMDLGLKGRTALVMASSRGLGLACASALMREGCNVFLNGRDQQRLNSAADELATAHGIRPATVVGDDERQRPS